MIDGHTLRQQLHILAGYHGWANQRLLANLETLPDQSYFAPAGLFFGSIHGTLNHLLLGDRAWYGRFVDQPESYGRLDLELEPDRARLAEQLRDRHALWEALVHATTEDVMVGTLHYRTTAGIEAASPWIGTLLHVFNHATHHRGQITAAVTRLGLPCPELDLMHFLRRPTA